MSEIEYVHDELYNTLPKVDLNYSVIFPEISQQFSNNYDNLFSIYSSSLPIVSLKILFKNNNHTAGLANFFASMLFKGTAKYDSYQISEQFDILGAKFNSYAGRDYFVVELHSLKNVFLKALNLLIECITKSIFPLEEIEKLKNRLTTILNQNYSNPDFLSDISIRQILYSEKYQYPIIGTLNSLSQINQEELQNFGNEIFDNGMIAILSGDWNQEIINELHGIEFFKKNTLKIQREKILEPAKVKEYINDAILVDKKDSHQSSLILSKKSINSTHHDYLGVKYLSVILGGYFGSRLNKNTREIKGYTYGISAYIEDLYSDGCWGISASIKRGAEIEIIDDIYRELTSLSEVSIDKDEFSKVRNFVLSSFQNKFLNTNQSASQAIYYFSIYGNPLGYIDEYERLKSISLDELEIIKHKYFSPENFKLSLVGNIDEIRKVAENFTTNPIKNYHIV